MKQGMSCHGKAPVSISTRTDSTSGRASNKLTPNCIKWGEQCARVEVRTKRAYLTAPRPKLLSRLDLLVSRALCRAATTILCRLGGNAVRPGMPDGADVRGREEDGTVAPLAPPNVFFPDDTRQASVHRPGEERRRREREASGSVLRVFGGRRQLKRRRLLLSYAVGCLAAVEGGDWSSSGGQTSTSMGGGGSNRKSGESVFQLYSIMPGVQWENGGWPRGSGICAE